MTAQAFSTIPTPFSSVSTCGRRRMPVRNSKIPTARPAVMIARMIRPRMLKILMHSAVASRIPAAMTAEKSSSGSKLTSRASGASPHTRPPAKQPSGMVTMPQSSPSSMSRCSAFGMLPRPKGIVNDTVQPIIEVTTMALKAPMAGSRAAPTASGAPPMSFAKMTDGRIDGSIHDGRRSNTGCIRWAISGDAMIIPTIDSDIVPSSSIPRSNSRPSPRGLPKMRSAAASSMNAAIT